MFVNGMMVRTRDALKIKICKNCTRKRQSEIDLIAFIFYLAILAVLSRF